MDTQIFAPSEASGTIETEAVERLGSALPVAIDAHARLHVDASAEQRLELSTGVGARRLEHLAAATDHGNRGDAYA